MKKRCPGTGHPAAHSPNPLTDIYPFCPVCGREMAAQGRKAQRRFANAWKSVPLHYADSA